MTKKFCPLNFISQKPYIVWSWLMVHMCKGVICPGVFLNFFQILIVGVSSWAKKQKMAWNGKKLCLASPSYLSKHTSYDRVFLLHKFKMMTSPNAFFIFSKLCFSELLRWRELKRQKIAQNDKSSVSLCILGTVSHMIVVFGTHV